MKLQQTFDVQAPAEDVFHALRDLEGVAPCLPGARVTGHDGNGTYHGEINLGLARLRGSVEITHSDPVTRTLHLRSAHATAVLSVAEHDGGARVDAAADLGDDSRLALFGGMVQDLSARMLRDFGACLSRRLSEPPTATEVASGAVAPEAVAGTRPAGQAPTGAEVTAGDAAPEAILAAAPDDAPDPDSSAG